jgi:hypothetical protein
MANGWLQPESYPLSMERGSRYLWRSKRAPEKQSALISPPIPASQLRLVDSCRLGVLRTETGMRICESSVIPAQS